MMRNGQLYGLRISDTVTGGSGYSLWRTPSDPTNRGGGQPPEKRLASGHTLNLEDMAEHWPTPDTGESGTGHGARGGRTGNGSQSGRDLKAVAANWYTPNVPNGGRSASAKVVAARGKTEKGKRQVGLESQSRFWATLRSGDRDSSRTEHKNPGRHGKILSQQSREWRQGQTIERHGPRFSETTRGSRQPFSNPVATCRKILRGELNVNSMIPTGESESAPAWHIVLQWLSRAICKASLNATFTEWLMGFPLWFTDIDGHG